MELEKAVDILENCIADYVLSAYCGFCDKHCKTNKNGACNFAVAIATVCNEIRRIHNDQL